MRIPLIVLAMATTSAVANLSPAAIFAVSGQPAPGVGQGFGTFPVAGAINANGSVAFSATVSGPRQGYWTGQAGSLATGIAVEGDLALGGATSGGQTIEFYGSLRDFPQIADDGTMTFRLNVQNAVGAQSQSYSIYTWKSGVLSLVAKSGFPAGTLGGSNPFSVVYDSVGQPRLSNSGRYAYAATVSGTTGNQTIWTGIGGSQVLVARTGGTFTGQDGFTFAGLTSPAINSSGNVAFTGTLGGATSANNNAIWVYNRTSSITRLIGREGTNFPELIPNGMGNVAMNNADEMAVATRSFAGGSVLRVISWNGNTPVFQAIWAQGNVPSQVFDGATFGTFDDPAFVNSQNLAVRTTLENASTSTDSGIWALIGGQSTKIAREDDQVPGLLSGTRYTGFTSPMMNARGDIAFLATLSGASIGNPNDAAVFLRTASGVLTEYARVGEFVDLGDGTWGQIASLAFATGLGGFGQGIATGGQDGKARYLTESGEISYVARLIDGREVLLSSITTAVVPEPELAILVWPACFILGRRR